MALLQPVEGPRALHERRKLEVFDPATLERVGEIEVATTEDVQVAVEHARKAFESWRSLSFRERERYMLAVRDVIVDRADRIAEPVCSGPGKPRPERVADGAGTGRPTAPKSSSATGGAGTRTARLSRPALASRDTGQSASRGSTRLKAPGQKRSARRAARRSKATSAPADPASGR